MFQFWPSVVKPVLDALQARRVIEIGADTGRHTRLLAGWVKAAGTRLEVVDPEPGFDIASLQARFGDSIRLHRCPSLEVLADLLPADAVLIDGDHNWYTVYHELEAIYGASGPVDEQAPVAICHDVGWPYGRRDLYYSPERIPAEYRHDYRRGGMMPQERGLWSGGYNAHLFHAPLEGGPRNGVRTAIEDFLARRGGDFRVVWLPMLFGLAVIVPRARLDQASALEAVLDSIDLSPRQRSLCKIAELGRIDANRPGLVVAGTDTGPTTAARSYSSALPDAVLESLNKGSAGYRYKGRLMLLNPLDMANYLALIGDLRPAAVIEIGSLEGGRSEWLADMMTALNLEARVISVDLIPRAPCQHPGIDARVGDAHDLARVLPADEVRRLGHPLLIIEDSAHVEATCTAVLDYFDPLLAPGDYMVIEDGAFRAEGDLASAEAGLSPPSRAIDAFLARRSQDYQIDGAICDRFGYNATFNFNGWLRRR